MSNFILKCDRTGLNVQISVSEPASAEDGDSYEAVHCPACARLHLVNKTTGKALSDGH
jgi:hypothetical protein